MSRRLPSLAFLTSLTLGAGALTDLKADEKKGTGFFGDTPKGSTGAARGTPAVSADVSGALTKRVPKLDEMLGPPTSTDVIWRYLEQDFKFGYLDDVPLHLERLLAQPDLADRVADLREERGSSLVFEVVARPELGENGARFVRIANEAMEKRLGDTERIKRMLENLGKSESERIFAITALQRSGRRMMPGWLAAWRSGDAATKGRLAELLQRMPAECAPGMLALVGDKDEELVRTALAGLVNAGDRDTIPALLELFAARGTTEPIRGAVSATIRKLSGLEPNPAEAVADLVAASERRRRAARDHHERETTWVATLEGDELKYASVSAAERDRQLAAEFADAALRLDPQRPTATLARIAIGLDAPIHAATPSLPEGPDGAVTKALEADPTLLSTLLTRSLSRGEPEIAFHSLKVIRATRNATALDAGENRPSPIRQALAAADARIRAQAAFAALELTPRGRRVDFAERTVETLTAELSRYNRPAVIVIDGLFGRGNQTVAWLTRGGFEAALAATGREGFEMAASNPTVVAVVLEPGFGDWPAEETIRNFGGDERTAGLPLLVLEELEENELVRLAVSAIPGARMIPPDTSVANLAEILDETIIGDPRNRLPRMRRVKELEYRGKAPLILVVDGDAERAARTSKWLNEAKHRTRVIPTGRQAFEFLVDKDNAGLVDAIFLEADIRDWSMVETMNAIRVRPQGRDVPFFVPAREVPGDRWNWLISRSPRCRKLVRAADPGHVGRMLEREYGLKASEVVSEPARIAERTEALTWVGRLIAGEKPQFNPRPAIDALVALLSDPVDGPRAALALGGLPSAANQRKLAEVMISSTQPIGNRIAAAVALEANARKSSVALDGLTRKRIADAWRLARQAELRVAFAKPALLSGELSRSEVTDARKLAAQPVNLGAVEEAVTAEPAAKGAKPGPKPVAPKGPKAAEPKAAEKKSRGFFDD